MTTTPPTTATTKPRSAYFDNLKYVLIVLVVVGHFADPFSASFPTYRQLFFFIYLFHMPLFVFATGLFVKSRLTADGGFKIGRVGQFLVLYLIGYTGVFLLERFWQHKAVAFTPWTVSNATWYLLACALWYLLLPLLSRVPSRLLLPVLVAVAVGAGFAGWVGDLLVISRVLCFAPFFFAGYLFDRDRLASVMKGAGWVPRVLAAAGLVAAAAAVHLLPGLLALRPLLTARNSYAALGGLASWGPGLRLAWYAAAVVLSLCVLLLVPHRRSWMSVAGQRTLQVYLWHLFALRFLGGVGFVAWVVDWRHQGDLWASLVPLATAAVVAHVFALRPPFGLVAERVLGWWRDVVVPRRRALVLSAVTVVVLVGVQLPTLLPPAQAPAAEPPIAPASWSAQPTPTGTPGVEPGTATPGSATPVTESPSVRPVVEPVDFKQFDERWAARQYGSSSADTIRRWGCGPADMAMVAAALVNPSVTPAQAADWATKHGYWTNSLDDGKTRDGFFSAYGAELGVKVDQLNTGDLRTAGQQAAAVHEQARKALERGDWVIALMGKGPWTTQGHFVLAYALDGDQVLIRDSNSNKPEKLRNSWALFTQTVQRYWVVTADPKIR